MRRLLAGFTLGLMALCIAGGVACVAGMIGAESPGARAVDGAYVFVDLCALTLLSFLIWPGRA